MVTTNDLVCYKCSCNIGSTGNERVVCVHILPVLYLLSMLLSGGLAQHILIELCTQWNNDLEKLMKLIGKVYHIKNSIATLMRAEGGPEAKVMHATKAHTVGRNA